MPPRQLVAVYPRSLAKLPKIKTFLPWLDRWFRDHDANGGTLGAQMPSHWPNR